VASFGRKDMDAHKKLSEIQGNLKAPKGQTNEFGGYKYRSCEDILQAVKPFLGDSVLTISDTMEQVGERYYVKATATIAIADTSVSVSAYAREPEKKKGMDEAQITGATSSYARKYALNGLFAIDDTKDADATNKHGKGEAKKPSVPFNESSVKEWIGLATEASKKQDHDTFINWWPANKDDVIQDCGEELAKKVHAEFGKLLAGKK
jgi:hypothetical protein